MTSHQHYYSDPALKLFTFSKDQGHRAQQFLFYGALGPFWTITTSRNCWLWLNTGTKADHRHSEQVFPDNVVSIWNNKCPIFSDNYKNACLSIILSALGKP